MHLRRKRMSELSEFMTSSSSVVHMTNVAMRRLHRKYQPLRCYAYQHPTRKVRSSPYVTAERLPSDFAFGPKTAKVQFHVLLTWVTDAQGSLFTVSATVCKHSSCCPHFMQYSWHVAVIPRAYCNGGGSRAQVEWLATST